MSELLNCYNKGCGQSFDPATNNKESCRYHPGVPVFHDAYKGWSCCNKKSVDFTEFLNFKGCTLSEHSNEKPPEPVKSEKEIEIDVPEQIQSPIVAPIRMKRPPFDSQLNLLKPKIAPGLKQQIDNLPPKANKKDTSSQLIEIPIGTVCKNGGCNCDYKSVESKLSECIYHPGVPIFHEGMKFWSCCTKRTSDFQAFLNQVGCNTGTHKWIDDNSSNEINCRYDWHQTSSNVVVAIYAKMYHYEKSTIKINPIRLNVQLVFPNEDDGEFNIDLELRGVIDVEKTTAQMFGTKVEITMPKAEPGSWAKLDFPREVIAPKKVEEVPVENDDDDSDVDLDDIEAISAGIHVSEIK